MLTTHLQGDTIAIPLTFDGIEAATHRAIAHPGGMASVIKGVQILEGYHFAVKGSALAYVLTKWCCLAAYGKRSEQ